MSNTTSTILISTSNNRLRMKSVTRASLNPPVPAIFHYLFNSGDAYNVASNYYIYNNSTSTVGAALVENGIVGVQTTSSRLTGFTGASASKGSYVLGGSNVLAITGSFSICFWFYCVNTGGDWIMCFQSDAGNLSFNISSYGTTSFVLIDTFTQLINNVPVNYNQWYHYAITVDKASNAVIYYLNGNIINSNAAPYTVALPTGTSTTNRISLGYTTNSAGGYYQDARYYTYAISASYIALLYNNGNGNGSLP